MRLAAAAAGTFVALGVGGFALFDDGADRGAATAGARANRTTELAALRHPEPNGSRPAGIPASSSPVETARAWLEQNRRALGTTSPSSLHPAKVSRGGASGQMIVRMQESHDGVPVIGGQAVLAVDKGSRVVAAAVKTMQGRAPATAPRVSAAQAEAAAVAAASKGGSAGIRSVGTPALKIFDTRILGGTGLRKPLLTWQVEISRAGSKPLLRTVYISAAKGYPVASIDRLEAALNRRVCDANGTAANFPCSDSIPSRTEGQAAIGIADVDKAYDYAGATYSFFTGLGRDGIDGSGMRIDSTVRYCPIGATCPYANAYWDGSQMVYGTGYASADDVVGHELTHGVTQYTSNLFYWFQSGAINEAMSDIMGEFIDQTDGVGTDTAAVKWKIGEDLPGGAIRDMSDPPVNGDPDRTSSANYVADLAQSDSGGVHTNSGVANKAAFLMVDGGTFNGQTIAPIGVAKAARVWYQTEQLLTSGSDYIDLGNTLSQACSSLVGTASISSSDCAQVDKAVVATEMPKTPANAAVRQAAVCAAPGAVPSNLYSNNFDGSSNHTWTSSAVTGFSSWSYGSQDVVNGGYAKSGADNLWGDDGSSRSDSAMTMPGTVHVPSGGAYVHFKHAYGFEMNTSNTVGFYDGGVVEYSTDSGVSWHDAASLFEANGYTGTIANGAGTDNPLGGRGAFTGTSMGYESSRLNLSSLAGQNVKFRFRIGTDTGTGDAGWFIDDFRVYTCGSGDTTPPDTTLDPGGSGAYPADGQTVATASPAFSFSSSKSGSTFECRLDGGGWSACSSPAALSGVADGSHTFEVRAVDASGNTDASPASRTFSVDATAPQTSIDSGPAAWWPSSSATFAFRSDDAAATFQCAYDSTTAWADCSSPRIWSALTAAAHTFRVRAKDLAGNVDLTPAQISFTVDRTAPNTSITSGPPSSTRSTRPVFRFARIPLVDVGTFVCRMDSGSWAPCSSSYQPPRALAKGSHIFRVAAVDRAGNTDATPAAKVFRVY